MRYKAMLWKAIPGGKVACHLCAHRCVIDNGGFGFCGMRQNVSGELFTFAYGNVITAHIDPIEKKPFYHFLPGSYSYSIATIGCNFRCPFCQNWAISSLSARDGDEMGEELSPEKIVEEAVKADCKSVSYTYTEPTVFFEYSLDTAKKAMAKDLKNTYVTNGYMTKEAVEAMKGSIDAANVDLKFFKESSYKDICKGSLKPVLESIENMKKAGIWVEVTTLVVPGLNDSEKELRDIAVFLTKAGRDIPWHISRFHPDYKYTQVGPTPLGIMKKAREIGKEEGLYYVYLGNVITDNAVLCPDCGKASRGGKCASCGRKIEGVWK